MKQVSSLDIACILKELQPLLGSYIRKISQPDHTEISMELYSKELGKNMLRIIPPYCLYLSSVRRAVPQNALNFCMSLRKRLNNARLIALEQKDFERIVIFKFRKKEEYFLIVELFSKGNLILTDASYTIINVLLKKEWGVRSLKPQQVYKFPEKQGVNPLALDYKSFKDVILASDKDSIVKILAMDLSFGGAFAEELCSRAKTDKEKKALEEEEIRLLYQKWDELRQLPIAARFYKEDAIPFPMAASRHQNFVSAPSFNAALDKYYQQFLGQEQVEVEEKKDEALEAILGQQRQQLERFAADVKRNREAGDYIYQHYSEIKAQIEKIQVLRVKKVEWGEVAKQCSVKIKDGKLILSIADN
ncbi:NFACT family protein [Candidatus Woesearchaeota archaeon]|nr:NFACT family protein [Candidatus Woesearchaeota archaeon]